jgi:hypothetical protein
MQGPYFLLHLTQRIFVIMSESVTRDCARGGIVILADPGMSVQLEQKDTVFLSALEIFSDSKR